MREFAIEHFLDFDIAARDGVADEIRSWRRSKIFGVECGGVFNAKKIPEAWRSGGYTPASSP